MSTCANHYQTNRLPNTIHLSLQPFVSMVQKRSWRSRRAFAAYTNCFLLVHLILTLYREKEILPNTTTQIDAIPSIYTRTHNVLENLVIPPKDLEQIYNRSILLTSKSEPKNSSRVVTLTFANSNYFGTHFVQNLVCSFHRSNVTNWVVVVMDQRAASQARRANITHVHFDREYWSDVKPGRLRNGTTVTTDYARMIQLRTNFIRTLLHTYKDLDIVTTDGDTTLTTRPWETIPFGRGDTNCSVFLGNSLEVGASTTLTKKFSPSCGFMMLHNSGATRQLYDAWFEDEISRGEKEQKSLSRVLKRINHDVTIKQLSWNQTHPWDQDKLHLCVLDRRRFPEYKYVFKRRYRTRHGSLDNVVLFHPNSGDKGRKKVHLFRSVGQWLLDQGSCPFSRQGENKLDEHRS